ncbi:MAG: hypothetical protein Fur0021_23440 [Candidatus Promineifilaceae bacterium]
MKRTFSISLAKLLVIALLALLLAACERPLQPGAETTTPPETPQITLPANNILTQPTPPTGEMPADGQVTEPGAADQGTGAPAAATPTDANQPTDGETGGETAAPPTETEQQDATGQQQDVIHTVQSGDTLYSIGLQYGLTVEDLIRANTLADPNQLNVGDQILVPLSGNFPETSTPPETSQERIHFVAAGETLFRIGLLYGFTVEELAQYNGLADPNDLDVGQQIRIPPAP